MTQSTPNTQGASWEERFDALEIQDGRIALYKRQVKTLLREIASKERAEGERRGAERAVKYIMENKGDLQDVDDTYTAVSKSVLREARTLPADSTEEVMKPASDDTCYLEYVDGELTCTKNHPADQACLMQERDY